MLACDGFEQFCSRAMNRFRKIEEGRVQRAAEVRNIKQLMRADDLRAKGSSLMDARNGVV